MIARGADPRGATGRPRSRSLNLGDRTRSFHAAEPSNPDRAAFGGFERSINISTLCPENRVRYSGCLNVCGEIISDTDKNCADSALEAICISIKGDSRLQLARQLTAAALNCVISGGGSDCTGTSLYSQVFSTCNSLCADSASGQSQVTQCIGQLDCLNNGGIPLASGICQKGVCAGNQEPCSGGCSDSSACVPLPGNCHERVLVNEDLGLDFDPPGPAGSSGRCNDVIGNACKVLQPGEAKCGFGNISTAPETCQ